MGKFVIRRCTEGYDRLSSSYAVGRKRPVGKSVGGKFRFAKTAVANAATFRTQDTAKKVLTSIKRTDPNRAEATYAVVAVG